MTSHAKTYTNGYPFKRPKLFTCCSPAVQTATAIHSEKIFSCSNSCAIRSQKIYSHSNGSAIHSQKIFSHLNVCTICHKKSTFIQMCSHVDMYHSLQGLTLLPPHPRHLLPPLSSLIASTYVTPQRKYSVDVSDLIQVTN